MDIIKLKIKPPILLYIWILVSIIIGYHIIKSADNVKITLILIVLIPGLLYYYFLRYSCSMEFNKEKMTIKYFPFFNKYEIAYKHIEHIEYYRGFYSFTDKKHPVNYFIPKICYDSLFVTYVNLEKEEIKINVRIGGFKKIKLFFGSKLKEKR